MSDIIKVVSSAVERDSVHAAGAFAVVGIEVGDNVINGIPVSYGWNSHDGGWSAEIEDYQAAEIAEYIIENYPDEAEAMGIDDEGTNVDYLILKAMDEFNCVQGTPRTEREAKLVLDSLDGNAEVGYSYVNAMMASGVPRDLSVELYMDDDGYTLADVSFTHEDGSYSVSGIDVNDAYTDSKPCGMRAVDPEDVLEALKGTDAPEYVQGDVSQAVSFVLQRDALERSYKDRELELKSEVGSMGL